jgi:hypothetical protein
MWGAAACVRVCVCVKEGERQRCGMRQLGHRRPPSCTDCCSPPNLHHNIRISRRGQREAEAERHVWLRGGMAIHVSHLICSTVYLCCSCSERLRDRHTCLSTVYLSSTPSLSLSLSFPPMLRCSDAPPCTCNLSGLSPLFPPPSCLLT